MYRVCAFDLSLLERKVEDTKGSNGGRNPRKDRQCKGQR